MSTRIQALIKSLNAPRRFWWHHMFAADYVPPVYSFLTDDEWNTLASWYHDSQANDYLGGCQVPFLSFIQALVMGSGITSVVQLGHYAGYSTLMMGFMLRRLGGKHALYTIDISEPLCDFTRKWVENARLHEVVKVVCSDSAAVEQPTLAKTYLGKAPELLIIDSSHVYEHTLRELDLWYPAMRPGGFILCHDSSEFARQFDATGQGGVKRALDEWRAAHPEVSGINVVNGAALHLRTEVYKDSCGACLMQVPVPLSPDAPVKVNIPAQKPAQTGIARG
jgi:predicted O-methyltransferase YrrM